MITVSQQRTSTAKKIFRSILAFFSKIKRAITSRYRLFTHWYREERIMAKYQSMTTLGTMDIDGTEEKKGIETGFGILLNGTILTKKEKPLFFPNAIMAVNYVDTIVKEGLAGFDCQESDKIEVVYQVWDYDRNFIQIGELKWDKPTPKE